MILPDRDIIQNIKLGKIQIDPYNLDDIKGSSVDLHLSDKIIIPVGLSHYNSILGKVEKIIDTKNKETFKHTEIEIIEYFDIQPQKFALSSTIERIKLSPEFSAFVQGRSSWARIGLAVEIAGFIDAGFEGTITLEMFNSSDVPIRIYKGQKVCQIIFAEMKSAPDFPYNSKETSKYQGQSDTTTSKLWQEQ